jgi:biopolymer transport protein ExbB
VWDLINSGGWINATIAALSVLALALIVERLLLYRRARVRVDRLLAETERQIRAGDLPSAMEACNDHGGVVAEVCAMAIEHELQGEGGEQLEQAVQIYVRTVVVPQLRRGLRAISLIARSAPMLGLLGTVFGMIDLFITMATRGMGDPTMFTRGVGMALTTTAAGLLVAIPIIYGHGLLLGRVERIENDINHYVPRVLTWLRWWRANRREGL